MNFPPFWARGGSGSFLVWRWSFKSLAEAQSLATQAAEQLADRFRAGDFPPRHHGYYPDRPFREQVLQELKSYRGEVCAVITRNSYGCQVLNTSRVMFVDVDLPEPKRAGFFKRLFGGPQIATEANPADEAVNKVETWTRSHPEWGWRVYRTRSGLRLLATHGLFEPDSETTREVFNALGCDPLYQKLCLSQKCFRARLTPKPWRCGMNWKPERWPWLNAKQEARFRKWEAQYQGRSSNWSTCRFLRALGNRAIHPEAELIVKLHDDATRVNATLELA